MTKLSCDEMTHDLRTCKWHGCNRNFYPHDRRQIFCRDRCRIDHKIWQAARGRPLVDMLLEGKANKLAAYRTKLRKEIMDARGWSQLKSEIGS